MNYPEDTQDKRLAGKTFSYTVKVHALKQKSMPELKRPIPPPSPSCSEAMSIMLWSWPSAQTTAGR